MSATLEKRPNGHLNEIDLFISPIGAGKSNLDGQFGRINTELNSAVDKKATYYDPDTVLRAVKEGSGLSATQFLKIIPHHSLRFWVNVWQLNSFGESMCINPVNVIQYFF